MLGLRPIFSASISSLWDLTAYEITADMTLTSADLAAIDALITAQIPNIVAAIFAQAAVTPMPAEVPGGGLTLPQFLALK